MKYFILIILSVFIARKSTLARHFGFYTAKELSVHYTNAKNQLQDSYLNDNWPSILSDHLPHSVQMNHLKIVTWNILNQDYFFFLANSKKSSQRLNQSLLYKNSFIGFSEKDGKLVPFFDHTKRHQLILKNIIDLIQSQKFDLLALQEVHDEILSQLQLLIKENDFKQINLTFQKKGTKGSKDNGVVLYNSEKITLMKQENRYYREDRKKYNYMQTLHFRPKKTVGTQYVVPFILVNTHVRFQQTHQFTNHLRILHIANPRTPIIFLGDLNNSSFMNKISEKKKMALWKNFSNRYLFSYDPDLRFTHRVSLRNWPKSISNQQQNDLFDHVGCVNLGRKEGCGFQQHSQIAACLPYDIDP